MKIQKIKNVLENENGDLLVLVPASDALKYGFREARDRLAREYLSAKEGQNA